MSSPQTSPACAVIGVSGPHCACAVRAPSTRAAATRRRMVVIIDECPLAVAPFGDSTAGTPVYPGHCERSRSELVITDTELRLIAAAASIGDNTTWNTGYSTPAAIGTPAEL